MTSGEHGGDAYVRVWIDSWQQECCGEAWAVGDRVTFTVLRPAADAFAETFPEDSGVTIDWYEEHHPDKRTRLETVEGVIVDAAGVQRRYAPQLGAPVNNLYPVPGSALLTPVTKSDGDERRLEGFAGYVVTLQI